MSSGLKPRGYTVIEIMIFLAVTSILAVSTMTLINGQQRKSEFTQAIREFDSKLQDLINDVSTGYYPNADRVRCTARLPAGSGIDITDAPTSQGTNADCIFIGRVIQLAPQGTDYSGARVYTIAGQRLKATSPPQEVGTALEARGRVVAKGTNPGATEPDVYEDLAFGGSIRIDRVRFTYLNAGTPTTLTTSGIGFFTTFSRYTGSFLNTGSTSTDLIPVAPHIVPAPVYDFTLDQDPKQFVDNLNQHLNPGTTPSLTDTTNPSGGVEICILSRVTQQYALLNIGGSGRQLSTKLSIFNGTSCP